MAAAYTKSHQQGSAQVGVGLWVCIQNYQHHTNTLALPSIQGAARLDDGAILQPGAGDGSWHACKAAGDGCERGVRTCT
jgi:hypothetical protein